MLTLTFTEALAATTGLVGVWLTTKQNIWCWPIALISIIASLFVFFSEKLYQDALLQVFYFALTIYGWYNWLHGGNNHQVLSISRISKKQLIVYLFILIVSVLSLSYIFKNYTDAALPFWDSISLAGGIIGTIWMAKKWIEHWLLWIVVDIICTGIYLYKGLTFFTIQFFIFTLLAIYGYYTWKTQMQSNASL